MDADGAPISYLVLAEGTPVRTRDGDEVGLVIAVRAADREDIFDGITVATPDGERFVDADHVEDIRERVVRLRLDARQAARLPEPEPAPPATRFTAGDLADDTMGDRMRERRAAPGTGSPAADAPRRAPGRGGPRESSTLPAPERVRQAPIDQLPACHPVSLDPCQ